MTLFPVYKIYINDVFISLDADPFLKKTASIGKLNSSVLKIIQHPKPKK
ncbi:hypothetical protein FPC831_760009 [Flavobacterium psychrophilum]|nr:hypothetical protein FPC831_760009 [Flavobacterium psychrophilum]